MHSMTRRELLAAFLGSACVTASGCRSDRMQLPPGQLVGASVQLGHRLRDRPVVPIQPDQWRSYDVVVVGAGVAGLSAARWLNKHGMTDFVVLELEPEPGGTSRCGHSSVVEFPWGAHYVPAPTHEFPALVELLDEVGVFEGTDQAGDPIVAEQYRCRDPQERVFYKGTWYEGLYLHAGATPNDLAQLARFHQLIDNWVAWRDGRGRRAFTIPMAHCSDDAEVCALDQRSMADWMDQQQFDSSRLRWLVDYACRDDYGMHAEQTSAWAGLFYFAARRVGPQSESRPFITWPEGNGRLVRHLYEPIRNQVHFGWAVSSIRPETSAERRVIEVCAVSQSGERRGFRARRVILAVPQFLTPYLLEGYRHEPPKHVAEFQYGAWVVANVILDRPPAGDGFPLAWDNVLYESPALGYVCDTYQRGLSYGPSVLTYYFALCDRDPGQARQRLLQIERDGWADIVLSDLARAHPGIRDSARNIDIMRWGHAMIRPRVGFLWGNARQAAARPVDGIHFAHSDLSGLPLFEEAFYRGTQAADVVLRELRSEA